MRNQSLFIFLSIYIIIFLDGPIIAVIENIKGEFLMSFSHFENNKATPVLLLDSLNSLILHNSICSNGEDICYYLKNSMKIIIDNLSIINCFSQIDVPGLFLQSLAEEKDITPEIYVFNSVFFDNLIAYTDSLTAAAAILIDHKSIIYIQNCGFYVNSSLFFFFL